MVLVRRVIDEALSGIRSLHAEDIPDHHQCAFGQWYYGAGQKLASRLPRFREIESEHAAIHASARALLDALEHGDAQTVNRLSGEIESAKARFVERLEQLAADAETNLEVSP
ncbi:CZB domain-containing protein [Acidihalobacter ferrooxydans]|uniref:CZB domain-containing protein n=1 Tax=Acidihalobacter ferrooxydans TaxID=1765967 RepID=UPI001E62A835